MNLERLQSIEKGLDGKLTALDTKISGIEDRRDNLNKRIVEDALKMQQLALEKGNISNENPKALRMHSAIDAQMDELREQKETKETISRRYDYELNNMMKFFKEMRGQYRWNRRTQDFVTKSEIPLFKEQKSLAEGEALAAKAAALVEEPQVEVVE